MTTNPDDAASRQPPEATPSPGGGASRGAETRERRGGLGALGWGFIGMLWGYAIYRLGVFWHRYDDYSFGWFVPPLCLCLFWLRWNDRPHRDPVRAGSGTFLVLGLCAFTLLPAVLFSVVMPHDRFAAWLFAVPVVAITVIALYFIGGRSYARHFLVPALFLLLAVPWPLKVETPLTVRMAKLNAAVSTRVVNHLGTPAVRNGVLIETGAGPIGRDTACSGVRSFQAGVMISLFLGELFQLGFFRRALLLLGGLGITFLCNVVRTTLLVRASDLKGMDAVNLYYDPAGFIILGITTASLLLLAWMLSLKARAGEVRKEEGAERGEGRAESEPSEGDNPPATDETTPVAPIGWLQTALIAVVAWVTAVEAGAVLWFGPVGKTSGLQPVWALNLPSQSPEFRLLPISKSVGGDLQFDEGKSAEWRDAGGRTWKLSYLRWLPSASGYGATPPPARQLEAGAVGLLGAGMVLQTNLGVQSLVVNGVGIEVGTRRFLSGGRLVHVCRGYWKAGQSHADLPPERASESDFGQVFRALKARERGLREQRLIELAVWGMETDGEAQAAFQDYLAGMIGQAGKRNAGTEGATPR